MSGHDARPVRGAAIVAGVIQYVGWVALLTAIALVVLVGAPNISGFRYNGF